MEDDCIKSSVAGVMQKVNKLICVKPLRSRYVGEIGDVVVGRVLEVQQKRWKIETNSRLDSILQLSSVNLPGGELVKYYLHNMYSFSCYNLFYAALNFLLNG